MGLPVSKYAIHDILISDRAEMARNDTQSIVLCWQPFATFFGSVSGLFHLVISKNSEIHDKADGDWIGPDSTLHLPDNRGGARVLE